MQRDLQFLLDMLQSAELIMHYTAQCSKDEFVGSVPGGCNPPAHFHGNVQLQDSVIRRLFGDCRSRQSGQAAQAIAEIREDERPRRHRKLLQRKREFTPVLDS